MLPVVVLGLCALAAKGLLEGFYYALLRSQDFQWSPTVLLSEGRDPFAWYLAGDPGHRILMSQEPNYLHLLYVLLLPFAWVSWPVAKAIWALANIAMGLTAGVLLARDAGLRGAVFAGAVATFVAGSPFAHVVGAGQQSLLALLALTLAWRARARPGGGVALAVGATKYSLVLPLGLWLMLERRVGAVGVAAGVGVGGLIVFAALSGVNPAGIVFEPLQVSAQATHVGMADVLSLSRALGLDSLLGGASVYGLALAVAGVGVELLWRSRERLDDFTIFALLCQLSLFTLFHHLYDYVLLMPLFCRALSFSGLLRVGVLAYVGYFWFVMHLIDRSPPFSWLLKTPAAIDLMALASAAAFTAVVAWSPAPASARGGAFAIS